MAPVQLPHLVLMLAAFSRVVSALRLSTSIEKLDYFARQGGLHMAFPPTGLDSTTEVTLLREDGGDVLNLSKPFCSLLFLFCFFSLH